MGQSGAPNQARAARIILKDYVNGVLRYVAPPPGEQFVARFDPREGQEAAVQHKMHRVKTGAAERVPTWVEPRSVPELHNVNTVAYGAQVASRKVPKDARKKKRGGKGKHKGDVEYPYGLPPDMPVHH